MTYGRASTTRKPRSAAPNQAPTQAMQGDVDQPPTSFRITGLAEPARWVVDVADGATEAGHPRGCPAPEVVHPYQTSMVP